MISLTNVAKGYALNEPIIHVPHATFNRGEMVSIVGPNGCGKSTLLMVMSGLLIATRGEVTVDGHPAGSRDARALLSFVPDKPALFDDLTVAEQMAYVARLNGLQEPFEVAELLLDILEAHELRDRFPRSLSKGQRQKAGLLVATSRPFDALLLDEPTSGLDRESHAGLIDVLKALTDEGRLVITSTHNESLIDASTRVTPIASGVLRSGTSDEEE